jgi:basic membrane protein A and related proteins
MPKNLTRGPVPARRALLRAIGLGCTVPTASLLPRPARAADPLKVGFVYVSPVGQAGWSYQHDLGRQAMEAALGPRVRSTVVESVAEGPDAERVLRDLARQGHGLVFATSFGYLEPALRVAADFPQCKFEHAGGYKTAPNLNTYNARYYEARWLAGWLAGRHSRNGVAGYVAGFAVPEVVQGINAFTLGLRAANPQAVVKVAWLNTWFDPAKEREAALALLNQGADVLTNHSGSPAVPLVAQEKGVPLLAYQSDMRRFAPQAQLAAVTHHWGGYYTQVAQSVLAGRWRAQPVWGRLRDGFVRLSALSERLPAAERAELARLQAGIEAGRWLPFSGRLVDSSGTVRLAQGALDDAQISAMDWFVDGVQAGRP